MVFTIVVKDIDYMIYSYLEFNEYCDIDKQMYINFSPYHFIKNGGKISCSTLICKLDIEYFDAFKLIYDKRATKPETIDDAVKQGHINIVKLLVENGHYIDFGTINYAVNHINILEYLLTPNKSLNILINEKARSLTLYKNQHGRQSLNCIYDVLVLKAFESSYRVRNIDAIKLLLLKFGCERLINPMDFGITRENAYFVAELSPHISLRMLYDCIGKWCSKQPYNLVSKTFIDPNLHRLDSTKVKQITNRPVLYNDPKFSVPFQLLL